MLHGFRNIMDSFKDFVYQPFIIIPLLILIAVVFGYEIAKFNKLRKKQNSQKNS